MPALSDLHMRRLETIAARKGPAIPALPLGHPCGRCAIRDRTFCGVLDASELADFKSLGSVGRAEPSQCLFHEGDPADLVYNVTSGSIGLYRLLPDGRRQVAAFLQAGDFLGLTLDRAHAYTAQALEPVEYCRFARGRFDENVESQPEIS